MTPEQRSLRATIAAHVRWGKTEDRVAATEPGRRGMQAKFERMADPDGVLDPKERAIRAEHFRQAHMLRMSAAAAKARANRKAA